MNHEAHRAPAWGTAIQAAVVGIAAGLMLNALVSTLVLRGESIDPGQAPPATCKERQPVEDAGAPEPGPPALSEVRWTLDGFQARGPS
jgi:hypothetical protein